MKPANNSGTVVSLFSGAGGLDLGFSAAGFEIIWANDICPDAVATHNRAYSSDVAIHGCIDSLRGSLPAPGSVDLVIGGPPCQGFSVAGKMDPSDPRSKHVWTFLEIVEHLMPAVFVLENVKALATNSRWAGLRDNLAKKAKLLGYDTRLIVLDSSNFSVPQKRERMFLIGSRVDICPTAFELTSSHTVSVREALLKLPPYGEPGNDGICRAIITPAKNPVLRKSPYSGMLFNGQGRPLCLTKPANTLPASMGGNRTPIVEQPVLVDSQTPSWIEAYHSKLWKGGKPTKNAPDFLRRITVQEAAALQTFPKDMPWSGSQSSIFKQIGNAVPPVLAEHVAGIAQRLLSQSTVLRN